MKTTSYKISKQLAEAGFSEQVGFLDYYFNTDKGLRHRDQESYSENTRVDCFSYDLETILEALPNRITNENIFIPRIQYYLKFSKEQIWYENECNCDSDESCPVEQRFEVSRIKDESLADTAAKLWLKLKKEGLV